MLYYGCMEILVFIIYIIVFLYSVIFHEIAHGLVANKFGDDTARISGRISLNPLVHIDIFGSVLFPLLLYLSSGMAFGYAKPVPVNPYRLKNGKVSYRLVALAGVVTNLLLAIVAALVLNLALKIFGLNLDNLGVIFFAYVLNLNLILAIFNILPLPGFDGFNFLTTFDWFTKFISRTPLANPLFMLQYGLLVSLLLLMVFMPIINNIFVFVFNLFARIFGL